MSGPATLACVDGTQWNGSAPHCQEILKMSDQPLDGVISMASVNIINMMNIVGYMVLVSALCYFKLWFRDDFTSKKLMNLNPIGNEPIHGVE